MHGFRVALIFQWNAHNGLLGLPETQNILGMALTVLHVNHPVTTRKLNQNINIK